MKEGDPINSVNLVGRLTKDPDIRRNDSTTIASFTVAVDRRFKKDGSPDADFPSVKAFGKTAEFIEKYFSKGMRIGIAGRIQTGNYTDKDGRKIYTTDVVAENVEFVESKSSQQKSESSSHDKDAFTNVPSGIDEEVPFA